MCITNTFPTTHYIAIHDLNIYHNIHTRQDKHTVHMCGNKIYDQEDRL